MPANRKEVYKKGENDSRGLKFNGITLKTLWNHLRLQCRIFSRINGNAVEKCHPQALEWCFIGGKPLRGSEVELISVCEEKVFLCGVEQRESAVFIVDHEVFFRKTVGKMFPENWEYMVVRMDLRE